MKILDSQEFTDQLQEAELIKEATPQDLKFAKKVSSVYYAQGPIISKDMMLNPRSEGSEQQLLNNSGSQQQPLVQMTHGGGMVVSQSS